MMQEYRDLSAGICLRPMTYEDTDRIVAWRNSDAVRKNFIYQEPFTREGHENWIRTRVETGQVVQMIICDIAGGRPLGSEADASVLFWRGGTAPYLSQSLCRQCTGCPKL